MKEITVDHIEISKLYFLKNDGFKSGKFEINIKQHYDKLNQDRLKLSFIFDIHCATDFVLEFQISGIFENLNLKMLEDSEFLNFTLPTPLYDYSKKFIIEFSKSAGIASISLPEFNEVVLSAHLDA